jgi:hypothetical protein
MDLERELSTIKMEVDALQIAAAQRKTPWYKDKSTLISIVALLFSFSTTAESLRRTHVQDVQNSQRELREVLERLSEIPMEQVRNLSDPSNNISATNTIDVILTQENSFLTAHAKDIISRIPSVQISPSEYLSLGYAYMSAYSFSDAKDSFRTAYDAARESGDFSIEIGALRNLAYVKYLTGDVNGGSQDYGDALRIFDRYPGYDALTRISVGVQTEVNWANAEMTVGHGDLAAKHLKDARALLPSSPASPVTSRLYQTIEEARQNFGLPPDAG